MAAVVRTDQLTKDFPVGFWRLRPHRALDALTLDVPAGGVFGLLGPNGAGKTTTLKLLCGLLTPTAGTAEVLGAPPGDLAARRRLAFLPEHPAFYDHLSAEELLSYFAGLFGCPAAERPRRVAAALDRAGLGEARRRPIRQYSKGMVQRVGLAQTLLHDPELVILDEPMSGLDPIGRREVRNLILELGDEGRTVLFSSHILSDAEQLCQHVAILAGGRLVRSGALADLTSAAVRGWEIVVSGLAREQAGGLPPAVTGTRLIAEGRYRLEVAADARVESIVADLAARGAALVSVTPIRTSLEDVFVASVGAA